MIRIKTAIKILAKKYLSNKFPELNIEDIEARNGFDGLYYRILKVSYIN